MPVRQVTGVLCAGNISHDILVRPVNEFKWGTNTWVDEFIEDMGGNGSNTSYALGLLGVPVRTLGMVGPDAKGGALLEKLRKAGADISLIQRSSKPTTTTICVINDKGDRLFIQQVGSSGDAFAEPTRFAPPLVAGCSHYHQANLYSVPNLRRNAAVHLRAAKDASLTTSLDTGWATDGRWMEVLEPALPFTDLLFVNEDEARMLTGHAEPDRIARALRDNGASEIILKLGGRGCVLFTCDGEIRVPAFQVDVVDTTGAGDCFAAGLFAGMHRGWALPDAARLANAVGAMAVTVTGATRGVRAWDRTLAWMESATVRA